LFDINTNAIECTHCLLSPHYVVGERSPLAEKNKQSHFDGHIYTCGSVFNHSLRSPEFNFVTLSFRQSNAPQNTHSLSIEKETIPIRAA
jgi:hypothetical protein